MKGRGNDKYRYIPVLFSTNSRSNPNPHTQNVTMGFFAGSQHQTEVRRRKTTQEVGQSPRHGQTIGHARDQEVHPQGGRRRCVQTTGRVTGDRGGVANHTGVQHQEACCRDHSNHHSNHHCIGARTAERLQPQTSVREYVFYVFFQISKKHEMTYQKVVKIFSKSLVLSPSK